MNLDPVVVIGIGNPMRHDDGVGPTVVERLRSAHPATPGLELRTLDGEATRIIDAWRRRQLAVVVDAGRVGAEPGSTQRFELGIDPFPGWSATNSSHAAGLADAIELGRALDALPGRLVVIVVEPADLAWGEGLSPSVTAAVDDVVECVMGELAEWEAGQGNGTSGTQT